MATETLDQVTLVDADYDTALAGLNYTCQHYLQKSAAEFIADWESGRITSQDADNNSGISSCVEMLSLLRMVEDSANR